MRHQTDPTSPWCCPGLSNRFASRFHDRPNIAQTVSKAIDGDSRLGSAEWNMEHSGVGRGLCRGYIAGGAVVSSGGEWVETWACDKKFHIYCSGHGRCCDKLLGKCGVGSRLYWRERQAVPMMSSRVGFSTNSSTPGYDLISPLFRPTRAPTYHPCIMLCWFHYVFAPGGCANSFLRALRPPSQLLSSPGRVSCKRTSREALLTVRPTSFWLILGL